MCGRSIASSDAREHWCGRGKGGPRPALPANPGGQNVTDVLTQDVTHVMTSNSLTSPRMSLRQRSFGCHTRNYLAAMAAVNPEILVGRQDDGITKRFGHANQACIGEAHRNV